MVKMSLVLQKLLTEALEAIQLLFQDIHVSLQLVQACLQQETTVSDGMHIMTCRSDIIGCRTAMSKCVDCWPIAKLG